METLALIRTQVSPIMDIDFFLVENNLSATYNDNQLAVIIKGTAYERTMQRIQEFSERCDQTLAGLIDRVDQTGSEFDTLVSKARREDPGSAPSGLWVNQSDSAAVDRHNEKVNQFNNQLDLHRRIVDQANRAKERYDDAVAKLNDKKADFEEQIRQKMEDLKPALDQDILTLLGKLEQLAYDNINNKNNPFSAFLLGYLTKKAYIFLYDRIDGTSHQRSATDIFKKLSDETERIITQNQQDVKTGLHETAKFLVNCYVSNHNRLDEINSALGGLPYEVCIEHEPETQRLLAKDIKVDFEYEHLIDPVEINDMMEKVLRHKVMVEETIQEVKAFSTELSPAFDEIEQVIQFTTAQLSEMITTKTGTLDPVGNDLFFTIGIFDEDDQERYMKKHKPWLHDVLTDIETELQIPIGLGPLVQNISQTELLVLTAKGILAGDQALTFFLYKEKLQQKLQELINAIKPLDLIIENLNELPRKKCEEFAKRMGLLLYLSLLPLFNIGVLVPIISLIRQYEPGLKSENSFYASLLETQSKKLQLYSYIHLTLMMLTCAAIFAVSDPSYRYIVAVIPLTYLISFLIIYLKGSQMSKMKS